MSEKHELLDEKRDRIISLVEQYKEGILNETMLSGSVWGVLNYIYSEGYSTALAVKARETNNTTVEDFVTQFIETNTHYLIEINYTTGCATFPKCFDCKRGYEKLDPFNAFLLTLHVQYVDASQSDDYDYVPLIIVKEKVAYSVAEE